MVTSLQWTSSAFALSAAVLWLISALVKLPPAQITWESMNYIVPALQRQSRWNAAAAISAAITAALQAILIAAPTCITLG
jgi:hypothetical protein